MNHEPVVFHGVINGWVAFVSVCPGCEWRSELVGDASIAEAKGQRHCLEMGERRAPGDAQVLSRGSP